MDLLIKEAELANLVEHINTKVLTGVGRPILDFLDAIGVKRQEEMQAEKQKEEEANLKLAKERNISFPLDGSLKDYGSNSADNTGENLVASN